ADQKWALRNAKLRMSRKLTFVKGLLLCLDCEVFAGREIWAETGNSFSHEQLVGGCQKLVRLTPLDGLARVCLNLGCQDQAREIFQAYDEYLALIDDSEAREHLET